MILKVINYILQQVLKAFLCIEPVRKKTLQPVQSNMGDAWLSAGPMFIAITLHKIAEINVS